MFSLVYRSKAKKDFSQISIEKMLEGARKSNREKNITGCLLFHKGWFIQLLEGEEGEVKTLFKSIKSDVRHESINVLSMEESLFPLFNQWHMIFTPISEGATSHNQNLKRKLFDDIFHSSDAVSAPGNSKLALWIQVNKLLSHEATYSTLSTSNELDL